MLIQPFLLSVNKNYENCWNLYFDDINLISK